MILYGRRGLSHGATNLVAVMSPEGLAAVIAALDFDPADIRTEFYPGLLPQYHEKAADGLERFIARHGINILDFEAWTTKKSELGDVIYR